MHDFIMAEDSKLWDIICDGPHVPVKKLEETGPLVPKGRKEYIDRKVVEKNYRAKKILMCGIGPDEYNRVSACDTAKEILEALQTAHEGTTQVKQSKIDMLTTAYELFRMKDDESIQDMHTRFTSIINELHSLGDVIPRNKLVRKILSVLPGSWKSKVNVITDAKDLQTLTMDELIGNLKIYEMKIKKDNKRRDPKKQKNLVLKAESSDSSDEDSDMAYLTKRFQKMEQYKQNLDKAGKRNLVPEKRFNGKSVADNIFKQALAAWGGSLSETERESDAENSSMMAVETEEMKYDSMFALMAQSDDDDEEDEDNEINFRDVQRNLKSYSSKKLRSLSNVLIDAYYSLENDKEILTIELGEAEQPRDDLVVCVVDLNETIDNLEQEKEALNERITSVENERDDLMVVVVDLKETIKGFNNEKYTLEERVASTEEERDDLLVICIDLEETVEGLNREHKNVSLGKGKEAYSQSHILLENVNCCKNQSLQ
ncbi:COP1-interactive protein 1-like [Nicotiana sylvestris]|uniref:COP1-interactive protein 1-like n=1 Tax=Nicotiana sylvestris TaxID=4096 RepID=UPI00388C98D1